MSTEYRIRLDRGACEGIFACLVRDGRFVEGADGLATIEGGGREDGEYLVAAFDDDDLSAARDAARACPVGAIDVVEASDE